MPYNLGRTTQDTNLLGVSNNRAAVTKYTSGIAGIVLGGAVWYDALTAVGTNAKLVILSASGNEPNTVLGVSNPTAIPNAGGVILFTFPSLITIAAATNYFIGAVHDNGGAVTAFLSGASGSGETRITSSFTYLSPPGSWPGNDYASYDYVQLDTYVVVGDPFMSQKKVVRAQAVHRASRY